MSSSPPSLFPSTSRFLCYSLMSSLTSLIQDLVAAYESWDIDNAIAERLHEDFEHHLYPTSVGVAAKHRAEYLEWLHAFKTAVSELKVRDHRDHQRR
jgi:hypothetical protein